MDCKVVAEFRPIIGSCQFFVKMNKQIDVSGVVIDSNKIFLKGKINENIAVINVGSLTIAKDSISGFQATNFSIVFRIIIEPNKVYGSFKNEIMIKKGNNFCGYENYRPEIIAGKEVIIRCRQCSTPLTHPLTFRRVLPLPTTFDGSDFFCHGNSNMVIEPKSEDCLYGQNFVKINSSVLLLDKSSNEVISCFSCLAWLGVREKSFNLFWNSSVCFKEPDQDNRSVGLVDFISIIKLLVKKDTGVTSKIILYTKVANKKTHYLLVWVIEKSLSLLIKEDTTASEILLDKHEVLKVLYTYETQVTNMVKKWEKEINCSQLQISKQMMLEGLAYMKLMSESIPEQFRKTNQMDISYVMI